MTTTPAAPARPPVQATNPTAVTAVRAQATGTGPRIVDSAELLQGHSQLLICHLSDIYRLQTTRQGKLILTK